MFDITFMKDGDGWSLIPHSAAADMWLAAQFKYLDHDLTYAEMSDTVNDAVRAGFYVADMTNYGV